MHARSKRTVLAVFTLSVVAQASVDLQYWSGVRGCDFNYIACRNQPQAVCCEAPPGPENFAYAKAQSTGELCVLIFFETDYRGGCKNCENTAPCGQCFINFDGQGSTFNTMAWFNPQSALCYGASRKGEAIGYGEPASGVENEVAKDAAAAAGGEHAKTTACAKINVANVNGVNYIIPTDGSKKSEEIKRSIIADVAAIKQGDGVEMIRRSVTSFADKWAHLKEQ